LYLPEKDTKIEEQEPKKLACALDPGIRTIITGFDETGSGFKFGHQDIEKIDHLARIAQRMMDGVKRTYEDGVKKFVKTSKPLVTAARKIEEKIKNKIKDCHHRFSKFLCTA